MYVSPSLGDLPLDVQYNIVSYLPIAMLLKLLRTSRHNYELARSLIRSLEITVFSKELHGLLALVSNFASSCSRS